MSKLELKLRSKIEPKDIPNLICILRIILVFPIVILILVGDYTFALTLFVIAGVSDGIDGFLAKHFHWQSRLGSILDPIADKFLLVSVYVAMAYVELLPMWLVVAAFSRDIIIVTGGAAYHKFIGAFEMAPSFISKCNTFIQLLLIATVLGQQLITIPAFVINWMVYTTLVVIILSGMDYVTVWGRRALSSRASASVKKRKKERKGND